MVPIGVDVHKRRCKVLAKGLDKTPKATRLGEKNA